MFSTTPTDIPIVPGLLPGTVKGSDVYPAVDVTDATQSTYGSTKAYTISQLYSFIVTGLGIYTYPPVLASSTVALNATYLNGMSGIGASLTNAGTQIPFVIDGQAGVLNGQYLISNQVDPSQNGIYNLIVVGTYSSNWVLVRAYDFNSPANIINGGIVYVETGIANANTAWQLNFAGSVIVGTTDLNWSIFNIQAVSFNWNTVIGTSQVLARNTGYTTTNVSQTDFILPVSSNVGDTYIIKGYGSGGFKVSQNTSQQQILGHSLTTAGTGGYLASTNRYDSLQITCIVENTIFTVTSYGIITVN